uniref:Uncharacterized protein n=1 Tax=Arundo donax TaxID=35708 RepID=A0A0A8YAJ3_ARUDO
MLTRTGTDTANRPCMRQSAALGCIPSIGVVSSTSAGSLAQYISGVVPQ